MANFQRSADEASPEVTLSSSSQAPQEKWQAITFQNGQSKLVQDFQVPAKSTKKIANLWRYPIQGDPTNLLNGAGSNTALIRMDECSGTGKTKRCYIRIKVSNATGSPTRLVPAPHLIDNIQWLNGSQAPIQLFTGDVLWDMIVKSNNDDQWKSIYTAINSNLQYGTGNDIPNNGTAEWYIDLPASWMQAAQFYLPAVSTPSYLKIFFRPASTTVLVGSAPTITDLSLDVEMDQLTTQDISRTSSIIKNNLTTYLFPYMRRQTWTQAFNANSQYVFNLSGLQGDFVYIMILLRRSYVGEDLYNPVQIASFQFTDNSQQPISGNNVITDTFNRYVQAADTWMGSELTYKFGNFYNWSAQKSGPLLFITLGNKTGSYTFQNNFNLILNTAASGTSEVITLVVGNANAGTFRLMWITPYATDITAAITLGTSAANLQAAIEALDNFQGTITASGAVPASGGGSIGLTFGGAYENMVLANDGYELCVVDCNTNTSGTYGPTYINPTPGQGLNNANVSGVQGMTNGATLNLDLYGFTTGMADLTDQGVINPFIQ